VEPQWRSNNAVGLGQDAEGLAPATYRESINKEQSTDAKGQIGVNFFRALPQRASLLIIFVQQVGCSEQLRCKQGYPQRPLPLQLARNLMWSS
jgi:hypothetical protein